MHTDTQQRQREKALDLKPGARGRKDRGQEAVIKLESLQTRVPELVALKQKADDASQAFNDAIKNTAESSGLLAATVRKYVKARAGDKFEDEKTKAQQLALCFEEITDEAK
jgi:hypothetical protein